MAGGLIALLDDVAALARLAAASLDDVAGAAAKAGTKAAGVVVDDTAVTPRYVMGLSPQRELPIIGKWSYDLLKISICRYKGPDPNEDGNLVLIGHNYKSGAHFGDLDKLSVGSELFLTNTKTGERVRYEVYQVKHIAPDAFSALKSYHGDAGLTLMTCRSNGTNRLLLRCEQKAAEPTVTPSISPMTTPIKTP